MKLSFSTNGWNSYKWNDCFGLATSVGFDGIEIHNIKSEVFSGEGAPFSKENIKSTVRTMNEHDIEIPCIDCTCNIALSDEFEANVNEIKEYIDYAVALHAPYVRIHAMDTPDDTITEDKTVVNVVNAVLDYAKQNGIVILIETCGIYGDTKRLSEVLNTFADDSLAALWDLNHPYRFFGETADVTIKNLGAYVKHVQIKDSKEIDGEIKFCLMGEGDLPIDEMIDALNSISYSGYISFECFAEWLDELGDGEIAFPHFINYMSRFNTKRGGERLYTNKAGTGKFIWKKETLINKTFPEVLDRVVEEFPDQYAFKYTTLDYTRTYSEFRDDVDTFARSLIALGVKHGDKVAVWATNVPQWYIAFWATTKIGAVLVTVNTAYKIHEAEYLLKQSDTHTLVLIESALDSNYAKIIEELCPELENTNPPEPLHSKRLPFLRNVITVGFNMKGCLTWDEAMALHTKIPVEEVYRRAAAVNVHDVANMQYTSGTTGFPKGVMLTHYNIVNDGKCIGDRMDLSTADRMMIQVPMFHCFGMVLSMTSSMTHGATLSPIPYFSAKSSLACINQERITCFNGVPTMFISMLRHPDFAKTDFSYMRTGIMAGSNCPAELMREADEKMNMTIISVYGQTEASPGCTMSSVEDRPDVRFNTVGSSFPHMECKIVDPETGKDLPNGSNGEFVVRGYNVMKGYYKMPKETKEAIDKDGWLHSGDIACRDDEGNYYITGRLKDMIIRGGENIYPKEIEEFIFTCPKVKDVQVIGVPDKQYGEEIMACIILKEGEEMTPEEMKEYIQSHMARHKVPKYIDFVKAFPMNAAGKILKYKMREDAAKKYGL